jgi:hypothetical protein
VAKDSVIISSIANLGLVTIPGVDLVINQQLRTFSLTEKVDLIFDVFHLHK